MAGCYIVDDDFMLVTRWLLDDVPADGNPLAELAKAFLHRSATTAAKYETTREEKGVFLLQQVKTRGAEGVIFAAPSFCDPALLERPMLQDVLGKHKVPHTAFKYAENTGQMAPIREQAGTFADSVRIFSNDGLSKPSMMRSNSTPIVIASVQPALSYGRLGGAPGYAKSSG